MPSVSPTGVTAIDTTLGAVTVKVVDWDTPARLAEIVVEPVANALTMPAELIVAVLVDDELQVTIEDRSAVVPLL